MLEGEGGSLPKSEVPVRCFTRVGSGLLASIRLGWNGLLETNTLAYYKITAVKSLVIQDPGI
jgi:hypothetical protein